jgi:hypothetical protein
MRRALVITATAALMIGAFPSAAAAARATRTTSDGLIMECVIDSTEQGTVYAGVGVSSEYGTFAGLYWWAPGLEPFTDAPTLLTGEFSVTGTPDGSTLTATMSLYEFAQPDPDDPEPNPFGPPAGQATINASFTPDGEPVTYAGGSRGSNARFRYEVVDQFLAASGVIQLPEATFTDLSSCQAVREHATLFATHPSTIIERSNGIGMFCEWTDADRSVLLFASAELSEQPYSGLEVTDASGQYFAFAEATLDTSGFAADWELLKPGEPEGELAAMAIGGEPVGTASATATLRRTRDAGHFIERSHGQMTKFFYREYAVSGSITITTPAGTTTLRMDGACSANTSRVQERYGSR